MIIKSANGNKKKFPTDSDIRDFLDSYNVENIYFIILSEGDAFVQTGKNDNGFVLETHDVRQKKHLQSKSKGLTLDEILTAFIAFKNHDNNWEDSFEWEEIDLRPEKSINSLSRFSKIAFLFGFLMFVIPIIRSKIFKISLDNQFSRSSFSWYINLVLIFTTLGILLSIKNWNKSEGQGKGVYDKMGINFRV